jgi:DNA-binding MarR family transcriptional regulator
LPSLEIYDVLWTLENQVNHQMRLHELATNLFVARFNITRIIQRMEKEGYIKKIKCPEDKRGLWAQLTPKGLKMRKKIWGIYGEEIKKNYSSQLIKKEHQLIIKILNKLKINQ